MNSFAQVPQLESAIDRLMAGEPSWTLAARLDGEVRSCFLVFAMLKQKVDQEPRAEFQRQLRARLMLRVASPAAPSRMPDALRRAAGIAAGTLLLGSAVSPSLAAALVKQVGEAFGPPIAEIVEAAVAGADHLGLPTGSETERAAERAPTPATRSPGPVAGPSALMPAGPPVTVADESLTPESTLDPSAPAPAETELSAAVPRQAPRVPIEPPAPAGHTASGALAPAVETTPDISATRSAVASESVAAVHPPAPAVSNAPAETPPPTVAEPQTSATLLPAPSVVSQPTSGVETAPSVPRPVEPVVASVSPVAPPVHFRPLTVAPPRTNAQMETPGQPANGGGVEAASHGVPAAVGAGNAAANHGQLLDGAANATAKHGQSANAAGNASGDHGAVAGIPGSPATARRPASAR